MNAAISCRESGREGARDQIAEGFLCLRSIVLIHVDHQRCAASKGWTIADEHFYVDDGISGAEFENRPGFVALLKALKAVPFGILIVSELSCREQLETGYALKRLSVAVNASGRILSHAPRTRRQAIPAGS